MKGMGHIVLTGPRGIGKSTVVDEVIRRWIGPVDGLRTISWREGEGRRIDLCSVDGVRRAQAAWFSSPEHREPCCRNTFEGLGVELLEESGMPGGLTVLDELGFMEQDIQPFTRAVLRRLDRREPVLAVIREEPNPFLHAVAAHSNVTVVVVTRENRDSLPGHLLGLLTH